MLKSRLCVVGLAGLVMAIAMTGVAYAQSTVTMGMVEFAFQPSTATVAPGAVTFTMSNTGQFPHNIQFDDQAAPLFANDLTTGQSATTTVNLAPGTYTFFCPVPGHRERGMVGTLTVASAQPARAGGFDPLVLSGLLAVAGLGALGVGLRRRRTAE